jgi:parvulin-like peptidyl-prolyl isomerase
MRSLIRNAFSLLMVIILSIGCSSKPKYDDRIVLKAGNQTVTMNQLNWQYVGMTFLSPEDEFQKKSAYLQKILDRKLITNIGLEMGLENSVVIDSAAEAQIILSVAYQNKLREKLNYTVEDLRKYWSKHGALLKVYQIVVETQSVADNVYSLASKEPEKFAEFAFQYSIDNMAKTDSGLLDTLRAGKMVWQFNKVAFDLKPGEISKPFKTKFGWHIIKLVSRQEPNLSDFTNVKPTVETAYINLTQEMMRDQYLDEVKKNEGFQVVDKTLAMMKDKLDSLQNIDRQRGDSIRPFLRLGDLPEPEAKMVLVKIKCQDFTAYDYVGNYKSRGIPSGVDLFDKDVIANVAFQWRFGLASQLDAINKKVNQTPEYKDQIKEVKLSLVYRKTIEQISDTIVISDKDARAYYEENTQAYFSEPERIRVLEILVATETEANQLLDKIRNGTPFAKLVEKTIRPGMIEKGGDLGYLAMGDSGVIYDEAAKLKVGQYGGPVKSHAGYSVIMVKDKTLSKALPYEKFEADIKDNLKKFRLNDILVKLVEVRKKKDENFIDLELLKANLITGKLQNAN